MDYGFLFFFLPGEPSTKNPASTAASNRATGQSARTRTTSTPRGPWALLAVASTTIGTPDIGECSSVNVAGNQVALPGNRTSHGAFTAGLRSCW